MIALIATTKDGGMGTDHGLPWRCPVDLQDFLRTTIGQAVIVGRKTFETIPNRLVGRRVVVLSRKSYDTFDHVDHCDSVEDTLYCLNHMRTKTEALNLPTGKVFVIGGKEIYDLFLPEISEIHHTVIPEQYVVETPTVHIDIPGMMIAGKWTTVSRTLMMGPTDVDTPPSTNFAYKTIYKKEV